MYTVVLAVLMLLLDIYSSQSFNEIEPVRLPNRECPALSKGLFMSASPLFHSSSLTKTLHTLSLAFAEARNGSSTQQKESSNL